MFYNLILIISRVNEIPSLFLFCIHNCVWFTTVNFVAVRSITIAEILPYFSYICIP
jgi:hypothetical protein